MEILKLAEALAQMEAAQEPFTLRFVKVDRRRKTGGQIEEWQNCRLSHPRGPRRGRDASASPRPAATPAVGAQNHYRNGTRNLVVGASSQRRKVHIWLLLALDGRHIVLG